MADEKKVGSIFVELSLDATKYTKAQQAVLDSAGKNSADIQETFRRVGTKSDEIYNAMRKSVEVSLEAIKRSHLTTAAEKVRAEESAQEKIKQIDAQQYGHQTSLLDAMKKNYVAAAAIIAGAWMAVNKAMAWAELGAKAMQAEESFRIVSTAANESADNIVASMKRASAGTVDDSDIMQKAVKGMVLGLNGDQLIKIMEAARVSARVAGEDVRTAYESITDSIATGMPKALKRYGLITKEEMAVVNAALKAGVDNVDLYTIAMMNAGIQSVKMGELHRNAAESLQVFHAQVNEMKEALGKVTISVETELMAVWKNFFGFVIGAAQGMATVLSLLPGSVGKAAKEAQEELGKWRKYAAEDYAKLKGIRTDAEKKEAVAAASGAAAKIAALEAEKKAFIANIKAQTDAAKGGKADPATERRAREVAKMYADEGKLVHEALMDEMGMTQEYHDTLRKLDDEAWKEEQRISAEILKMDAKRYAEEGAMAHDALAAEMGLAQEYLDTVRSLRDAELKAWKEAHDPKSLAELYESIVGYEQEAYERKIALIEAERDARIKAGIDAAAATKKAEQEIGALNQKLFEQKARQVHSALDDMAYAFDAIGGMYDKNSSEYARMQEAAKAMIVLQQAVAVANAVAAIANQGLGDPYTAFGRIAAMVAAMGSLLASAGLSLGGDGGSSAPVLPASTVLGAAPGTGSESASKSMELLEDLYSLEYRELTGIHDSMKELNRNITGLVTSIVRTGGVGSIGEIPGSADGTVGHFMNNLNQAFFGSLGKLGDTIGNWIGGIYNSVFGGGSSSSQTAGGIQFGGSSVGGLLAGGGMNARQYAEITTTTEGGWFHGDSTSVEMRYQALDAQVSDMLDTVFVNLSSSLIELAKSLGTDTQAALEYVFAETKVNLQGKTTEEINKAISEFISNTADTAVQALFGDMLRGYQQLNEGLFETAVRLLRDKAVILDMLSMTNQAFVGTTAEAIAFSEALINIAGDLDALTKAASTYYDKFFTDTEKHARLQEQLSGTLADMDMVLPATRDGYRALVEGLNLTTDAGKQAYVTLLNLAEGADKFYSAQEDALKAAQDKYLAAQKAYLDEQVQIWDAQLKAQQTLVNGLKSRVESVTGWIAGIKTSSVAAVGSALAWQTEYARQKEMATATGASDATVSGFLGYAKTYLDFQKKFTGGNYLDTYNNVLADVKSIGDLAAAQIPAAERQLSAIQSADDAARTAAAAQLSATRETNATLLALATDALIKAGGTPNFPAHAAGGLTSGPTISGEIGREWNVPTYEPQRSRFLRDVGADPDSIGRAVARHLGGATMAGGGGKDINVNLYIDGKQITTAVVRGIRGGDQGLIKGLRKAVA